MNPFTAHLTRRWSPPSIGRGLLGLLFQLVGTAMSLFAVWFSLGEGGPHAVILWPFGAFFALLGLEAANPSTQDPEHGRDLVVDWLPVRRSTWMLAEWVAVVAVPLLAVLAAGVFAVSWVVAGLDALALALGAAVFVAVRSRGPRRSPTPRPDRAWLAGPVWLGLAAFFFATGDPTYAAALVPLALAGLALPLLGLVGQRLGRLTHGLSADFLIYDIRLVGGLVVALLTAAVGWQQGWIDVADVDPGNLAMLAWFFTWVTTPFIADANTLDTRMTVPHPELTAWLELPVRPAAVARRVFAHHVLRWALVVAYGVFFAQLDPTYAGLGWTTIVAALLGAVGAGAGSSLFTYGRLRSGLPVMVVAGGALFGVLTAAGPVGWIGSGVAFAAAVLGLAAFGRFLRGHDPHPS